LVGMLLPKGKEKVKSKMAKAKKQAKTEAGA
jgi:hypothetical protein